MVRFIVIFYSLLGLAGAGLIGWRVDDGSAFDPWGLGGERWPVFLLATLGMVWGVHVSSVWAVRIWEPLSKGVAEMRQWLGSLSPGEVLVVALASGLGEELFFRGWLLNEIGLVWSSVIFGLIHIPPSRNWLYWPFFAFVMGLGLGAVCLWTDSLVYAVLVHAGINFINILRLPRHVTLKQAGGDTGERDFPGV